MSYEPFALKYRPRTFADVVGQEAVGSTLKNAIATDRIANAFLFSGSRGVGKTSMARILAKALNCREVKSGEPCGSCELCLSIARGEDIDIIEIDGASNRGIDEIRTVRDNVGYAPSRARYKVYIIDEVHMLTVQAFNALLKTLEEPPPHVKFIFATTEPQAVPETIVSRCQRFEFRRITVEDLVRHLSAICAKENISATPEVLSELARKGEGGLRDALSLLDQSVAFAGTSLTIADLDSVLGLIDSQVLEAILTPLAAGEAGPILDALDLAFESGRDAENVLDQLTDVLREAMVREARGLSGGGEGRRASLVATVTRGFDLDRLLFALRILLNARREIRQAGHGRLQLEVACLKIARSKDLAPIGEILERLRKDEGLAVSPGSHETPPTASRAFMTPPRSTPTVPLRASPPAAPRARVTQPTAETPAPPIVAPPSPPVAPSAMSPARLEVIRAEWPKVVRLLKERKPRSAALLDLSEPAKLEGSALTIHLPASGAFAKQQLEGPQRGLVEGLITEVLGHVLRTQYDVASAKSASERPLAKRVYDDPSVRKVIESFGGGIVAIEDKASGPPMERGMEDEGV